MEKNEEIPQEDWETIERFLLNDMVPEERLAFEAKLSAEASLQARVAEVRLLMIGVNEAVLQEQMKDFHQELTARRKAPTTGSKIVTWRRGLIAASVILMAGIAGWLLLTNRSSEEKLFATFFKPDPGLITAMSATDNYAFEKAMIDYKKGEYKTAVQTWDSLQKLQPANDTVTYFLGVAHLANKNAKDAIGYLQKVSESPGSFFRTDASWYLGLALLREGRKGEAIPVLEASTHTGKEKLLNELKN